MLRQQLLTSNEAMLLSCSVFCLFFNYWYNWIYLTSYITATYQEDQRNECYLSFQNIVAIHGHTNARAALFSMVSEWQGKLLRVSETINYQMKNYLRK